MVWSLFYRMNRMCFQSKKIAFLSTGSELIAGDILNTNSQYAASILNDEGFSLGMHVLVTDDQRQIEQAFTFLLRDHTAIITIGGLGPTSDDLTRFALAKAFQAPLTFYADTWERITQRFKKNEVSCPENNRVQALFPEGSKIFPNPFGTADGCVTFKNDQWAYLLPGPPHEFKPMFDQYVLPHLLQKSLNQPLFRKSWLLLNMSESHAAQVLDPLLQDIPNTELAYRVHYPYLEVKLKSTHEPTFLTYSQHIEQKIQPFLVSYQRKTASEQLRHYIKNKKIPFFIQDTATGGLLETRILDAESFVYVHFSDQVKPTIENAAYFVEINGLHDFWQTKQHPKTPADIQIQIQHQGKTEQLQANIPVYTDPREYAAETAAWLLLSYLKS